MRPAPTSCYQLLPGEPGGDRKLGELIGANAQIDGVTFHGDVVPSGEIRAMGAEQSNSSIVFGDEHVLKVFRRLEPGVNPELEMLRFLSARDFANIARLTGWYEYSGDLMDATLGVMQAYVHGGRDAWELGSVGTPMRCSLDAPLPRRGDGAHALAAGLRPDRSGVRGRGAQHGGSVDR